MYRKVCNKNIVLFCFLNDWILRMSKEFIWFYKTKVKLCTKENISFREMMECGSTKNKFSEKLKWVFNITHSLRIDMKKQFCVIKHYPHIVVQGIMNLSSPFHFLRLEKSDYCLLFLPEANCLRSGHVYTKSQKANDALRIKFHTRHHNHTNLSMHAQKAVWQPGRCVWYAKV